MKIKHLLLLTIISYLFYLHYHVFFVIFNTKEEDLTNFDNFAIITTICSCFIYVILIPFSIIYIKDNTNIFEKISKILNRKLL